MHRITLLAAMALMLPSAVVSQKRPLDHAVYDSWNSIQDRRISDDGRWVLYSLVPQDGDAVLHVRHAQTDVAYTIPRGRAGRFADGARFVAFRIAPELALVREAKKEEKKPDEQPKDSLGILNLSTGVVVRIERVKSFKVPEDAGGWLAYLLEKGEAQKDSAEEGGEQAKEETAAEEESQKKKKKDKQEGTVLVLRDLDAGVEHRYEHVTEYGFSKNGRRLEFATSTKDGTHDGMFLVNVGDSETRTLMSGEGVYKSAAFDEAGNQLAFMSNQSDYGADQPAFSLYYWRDGADDGNAIVTFETSGVPNGWWVSEHGGLSFSDDGSRLFFGTAPRPDPEPEEETPEWEEVKLDVWNWRDPLLQPNQLVQRDSDLERTYRAVVHLESQRVVQLADESTPTVTVGTKGDADLGIAVTNMSYRQEISWDSPGYNDVYVVDVTTGERRLVAERIQATARLSSGAQFVTWWDGHERAWYAADVDGGAPVNLTRDIPYPVYNELADWPMIPPSYGQAGWTEDDAAFLIYDKHDIWATDPTGRRAPRNITEGVGRRTNVQFRYVRVEPEQDAIPETEAMLLRTLDLATKRGGFYRDRVRGQREPRELVMMDRVLTFAGKAKDSDVMMITRQSFQEFPDLWVTDFSLQDARQVSEANPQQSDYLWGTPELVHWTSTDGRELDGILYKPENFDPAKKYPMMVYFYEKMSNTLHRYRTPGPGRSSISIPFYVSRGYVVFIPDIHYRDGYPGESALNCLVPGVLSIVNRGFIDAERIGVQGHSWGGYQAAFLITRTNIFAAVEAGAPVVNMTSAYGGIRWGSGRSRMFQYERSQSRLGGSLWDARPRYIENSPLFWADKIETPVLFIHNDDDGAVPWYQGIEFFVALRRLGKPAWMINYNGEPHGLRKYQNKKDWAIRMQQFFDHYLKGAPPPVWLAEGIPAVQKGKTLGLELVEETAPVTTTSGSRVPN